MKRRWFLGIVILGFIFLSANSARAYTIDGNLGDWGVDPSTPGAEDWVPNPGIYYEEEDTTSDFLDPGWGGQIFDSEAFYLTWDDTNLYLALVTGFPNSSTGVLYNSKYYSAGDIAIDFGVNGTYEYGIEIGSHSPEYAYPESWWAYSGTQGDIYKDITWRYSDDVPGAPINMHYTGTPPTLVGSVLGGEIEFQYLNSYPNGDPLYDHWVVEMSIDRGVFGDDWDNYMRAHWTQTCSNDITNVTTPEPMSLVLFGTGAIGILFGLKRKKR
jgi:hypothetical protein